MKDVIKIILGNIFITVSYAYLIVPYKIINGGVTSSALILHAISGVNVAMLANVVTLLLLLLCLVFLGKENFFKSILSSCCYMTFFYFFYSQKININLNIIIIVLIASVLLAIGYYLCLAANASTVGFDVLALILHRKNKKIKIAVTIRCINLFILFIGLTVYGFTSIISGIAFTIIYSYLLDKFLKWNRWGRSPSHSDVVCTKERVKGWKIYHLSWRICRSSFYFGGMWTNRFWTQYYLRDVTMEIHSRDGFLQHRYKHPASK